MTAATAPARTASASRSTSMAFRLVPAVSRHRSSAARRSSSPSSAPRPLAAKPKVRVTLPGLAPKTYGTSNLAGGGFVVTVNFPVTAGAGTAQFLVTGTDTGAGVQTSAFSYQLN